MNIELITAIGALLVAFVSAVFSIYSTQKSAKRLKLEAIKDFYAEYYSQEMVDQREKIGKIMFKGVPYDFNTSGSFARYVEFFDKWSLLEKNGYIPFSIFEGSIGIYATLIYEYLHDYIQTRRNGSENVNEWVKNPKYAYYMEELVEKVKKRLG